MNPFHMPYPVADTRDSPIPPVMLGPYSIMSAISQEARVAMVDKSKDPSFQAASTLVRGGGGRQYKIDTVSKYITNGDKSRAE
jgi:hypothetical protein